MGNCPPYLKESEFESALNPTSDATGYGIAIDIQRRLAAVRTDLDSFNDIEAFALMTSGYRMTDRQFARPRPCVEGFPTAVSTERLAFSCSRGRNEVPYREAKAEASRKYLGELLDVATSCGFKVWNLSRPLRCMKWVICAAAFAAVVWLFYQYWEFHIIPARIEAGLTYRSLGIAVLTIVFFAVLAAVFNALAGAKLGKRITRIVRWRDTFR